jgi:NhaP-type Na+/H+ or K+/H+ antiporter
LTGFALLAALFFAYALIASRFDRWSITAPVVLVLAGIVLGPAGTGSLQLSIGTEPGVTLAELALALLLFTDAATVRLREAEGEALYPGRLLLIGLPLTIVLGAVACMLLFPTLGWPIAAVVGTILAPTDAALSLPLLSNPAIPARIRHILNIESGLNDGIATPFLTFFLAVAAAAENVGTRHWAVESAVEIGLAVVTAVLVGGAGGWLLARARQRNLASNLSSELAIVALAMLAYGGSIAIGGNGFVAAFGAGIAFRESSGRRFLRASEFAENLGMFASFLVWVLFGAAIAGPVLAMGPRPEVIAYALLSLTVVRMLPVAVSLLRSGFRADTVAMIGWFGPRGLASVVFTVLAYETLQQASVPADDIVQIATWTVVLSIVAHGLSAGSLARIYGRRMASASPEVPERREVAEPRLRRGWPA